MNQPKFILTNTGFFRLGMVNMHKDLLQDGEECCGGGYYEFDYIGNRLILSGRSYDFGSPQWSRFDTLKVPIIYQGLRMVYVSMKSWEDDFIVGDELKIEYVE